MKKYIAVILLIVLTMLTGCAEERDKIERQDSDVKELELEKFLETYNEITEKAEEAWDINNSDDDYNKAYREAVKEAGFKDGEKYLLSGYVYSVEKYEDTYRIEITSKKNLEMDEKEVSNFDFCSEDDKCIFIPKKEKIKVQLSIEDNYICYDKILSPKLDEYEYKNNVKEYACTSSSEQILQGEVYKVEILTDNEKENYGELAEDERFDDENYRYFLCAEYATHIVTVVDDRGENVVCFVDVEEGDMIPEKNDKIVLRGYALSYKLEEYAFDVDSYSILSE